MDNTKEILKFVLSESPGEDDFDIKDLTASDQTPPPDDPYDIWVEKYRPIKNTIVPSDSFDGMMFETYGAELEFVQSAKPNHVWTYVTGDNGEDIIVAGFHRVN